jgi:hypothetical protein
MYDELQQPGPATMIKLQAFNTIMHCCRRIKPNEKLKERPAAN